MADEQIIYLSPEEELTNVRERLERVPTRRIILVIPAQTQLRSHVSWRLLHARARELNKDILIISSDRQIRSVVKAAGFRVADSLESPPSSSPRPTSRSGRTSQGGRTASRLRTPPGKAMPNQPRRGGGGVDEERGPLWPPVKEDVSEQARPRSQERGGRPQGPPPNPSPLPAPQTGPPPLRDDRQVPYQPPMQQEVDDTSPLIEDMAADTHERTPPASSTFGMNDWLLGTQPPLPTDKRPRRGGVDEERGPLWPPVGEDYDYHTGPPPSIRPIPPPSYEDDEPNLLLEDYQQSQSIRQAAQQNDEDTLLAPPPHIAPEATPLPAPQAGLPAPQTGFPAFEDARPQIIDLSHDDEGPFTYLEDDQPASLPEQHASVPVHEMDDSAVDISDYPTDVLQIEDQGDMGDFVDRESSSSPSWTTPTPDEEEEQDMPGPSRIHGMRPRTNRTGKVFTTPPLPDFEEDDNELPPVYGQAMHTSSSPLPAHQSGTLASQAASVDDRPPLVNGRGEPKAVPLPQTRTGQQRTAQPPLKKRPPGSRTGPPRTDRQRTGVINHAPTRQAASKRTGQQRSGSSVAVFIALGLLILLIIGLIGYLLPSADVTITLPSQSYPLQMKLTANASSHQDVVRQTLPAQQLRFDTSVTGTGKATGSTTVGTVQAKGNVIFTNNGPNQVIIPTGTIVATKNGVQFVTQAEALVLTGNTNTIPTLVQALNPGVSGNVPAGSITVIPVDSQNKILQYNPSLGTLNLSVTNTDPTTGGGAGSATTVSTNDVNAEKSALDIQLQSQVDAFLKKNVHAGNSQVPGDQVGKPVQVETPLVTPAVGQVTTGGTFTETLKLHMTVLVVRTADLQAAAAAQLKDALNRQKNGLALVPQQVPQLKQLKNLSPNNGTAVVLSLTAVGLVAPQISEDTVRKLVSGKTVDEAKAALNGRGGIPNVLSTQITINPGFFHWVPFFAQRINIYFKAVEVKPIPAPKPKPKPKHG